MSILVGDTVRKDRVEAILSNMLGELGCGREDIELFLCPIFGSKEEITFQEFLIRLMLKGQILVNKYDDNSAGDCGWPH